MPKDLLSKNIKFNIDVRPLHTRLEEAFEMLIQEYDPGDRLPSEKEMAQILNVSRSSVREVLGTLEERGRISRRHGIGTFVASNKPPLESGLEILESLDEFAQRRGILCEVKDLNLYEEGADADLAEKLNVPLHTPLTIVTRTRSVDNLNISYMYDATLASIVSAEDLRPGFDGSLLDYLRKNVHAGIGFAKSTILSIEASRDIALKMEIERGSALLLLEEFLYTTDDRLINFSRRYYNTKYFHYHIIRRGLF